MNNYNNINITPALIKKALWGVAAIAIISVGMAFVRPWYNVWCQEMEGKAEFAKAEQNRKIKIEEAKANLEAEKLNAQAEIERAKGGSRGYTYRERQYHTYLYSISVGAPTIRPEQQNSNLCADRDKPAHS